MLGLSGFLPLVPGGLKDSILWPRNAVSENVEGKQKDLFEEMGVDTDETVGVDQKSLEQLMPKKRRV